MAIWFLTFNIWHVFFWIQLFSKWLLIGHGRQRATKLWMSMPERLWDVPVSWTFDPNFFPQLNQSPVLITGPSDGGIGAETALCLASGRPSTIILAGRDRAKIQPVINKISRISPEINTIFVALDLSDQASVRTAAAEVSKQVGHIDVLINNAAIMACPYSLTKDNFEVQFGTNFLGPFLFTGLLLPKLQAAGLGARIVNLSSSAHRFEGIRFDDIDFEVWNLDNSSLRELGWFKNYPCQQSGHAYDTWKAYGQSKTALILMAIYIADKVPNNEISTFSVHPGSMF